MEDISTVLLFMQKNALNHKQGLLTPLSRIKLSKTKKIIVVASVFAVILAFAVVALQQGANANSSGVFILPAKTESQNGLTIVATPQPFKSDETIKIGLALDTHSGALSYNLTQLATLEDSNGVVYSPTAWEGSALGGHHGAGTLDFPALNGKSTALTLVLRDVYGENWTFEWPIS